MEIKTRFDVGDTVYVKDILGRPVKANIEQITITVQKGKSGNAIVLQSYEVLIDGYQYTKTKTAAEVFTAKNEIIAEKISGKRKLIKEIEAEISELERNIANETGN